MALDPLLANSWLTEEQRQRLIASIELRRRTNMRTLIPTYSIDDNGTFHFTPLFVLKTMDPAQPMYNADGVIMTCSQAIAEHEERNRVATWWREGR